MKLSAWLHYHTSSLIFNGIIAPTICHSNEIIKCIVYHHDSMNDVGYIY